MLNEVTFQLVSLNLLPTYQLRQTHKTHTVSNLSKQNYV